MMPATLDRGRLATVDGWNPSARLSRAIALGAAVVAATFLLLGASAPRAHAAFGIVPGSFDGGTFNLDGSAFTQAGGHPHDAWTNFDLNRVTDSFGNVTTDEALRNAVIKLPAGFVGNPLATARCASTSLLPSGCPIASQVGIAEVTTGDFLTGACCGVRTLRVYNMVPPPGSPAAFAFKVVDVIVVFTASVRGSGDYRVTVDVRHASQGVTVYGSKVTLWGTPADPVHDARRGGCLDTPDPDLCPAGIAPRPFVANPTSCTPAGQGVETTIEVESWEGSRDASSFVSHLTPGFPLPPDQWGPPQGPTDCAQVPFPAQLGVQPTSSERDSASGLDVDLTIPQPGFDDPATRASAHLDTTVVTLPEGVSVNPSAAAGLEGCSDEQIGLVQPGNPPRFTDEDPFDGQGPDCPSGSKIGTVQVTTPLLEQPLTGEVVLGTPKSIDPTSGEMLRTFLVVRDRQHGVLVKIFGSAVADPQTGRLTATFDKNPQIPFSALRLQLKGGDRGLFGLPQRCGAAGWSSILTPWSAANGGGGQPVIGGAAFAIGGDCAFGFAPALGAGMDGTQSKGTGTFSFRFSRRDGEQWFSGLTASLPPGLLARVRDVPLCSNAEAAAGSCPDASRLGSVDAGAGSGTPLFLERKGDVYLTEGYKGGPYGLLVRVPVEAGPFRGDLALTPIAVRQAIYVDPTTAAVRVVSDPFPEIWHGIPLRVRQVQVTLDRPGFMVNPTGCEPKRIGAALTSTLGQTAELGSPFQARGCEAMPFKPKLAMTLTGRKQVGDGRHPGLSTVLTQTDPEANIGKLVARLPLSLALDPERAASDRLCEYDVGLQPEPACPQSSIIGQARAISPLLQRPLTGPVYFVKNVRIDARTGRRIRTLPTLLVPLRGEIALNLRGNSSVEKGKLVTTFANVPDAAVGRFELTLDGGRRGILVTNGNLCRRPRGHKAEIDVDAHSGKRHDFDIRMKAPCGKKTKRAVRGKGRAGQRRAATGRAR